MFPLVDFFFVPNLAKVGDVGEQLEQRALVEVSAAAFFSFLRDTEFVPPIASFDFFQRGHNRSTFQVELIDCANTGSFVFVDVETSSQRINVVAHRGQAADPFAFASGCGHLVSCSLGDDLAFELGER